MMELLTLPVQVAASAALAWSCFCRLVRTDDKTIREIRWAIWFEGLSAGMVLLSPVMPMIEPVLFTWPLWSTPAWTWLVLLVAATLVQIATATHWRDGVPHDFVKE